MHHIAMSLDGQQWVGVLGGNGELNHSFPHTGATPMREA